jgi:probable rRNA maturation factor
MPGCRGRIGIPALRRIARHVVSVGKVPPVVEVGVVLADAETVQNLNRLYRGQDEPTDVLSFATKESEAFIEAPGEAPSLGEVIVCLPVAEAQAASRGQPVAGQVAHLLVHGLLHLLGYDHDASEAESERMQTHEDALLADLGYAGMYEHGH